MLRQVQQDRLKVAFPDKFGIVFKQGVGDDWMDDDWINFEEKERLINGTTS